MRALLPPSKLPPLSNESSQRRPGLAWALGWHLRYKTDTHSEWNSATAPSTCSDLKRHAGKKKSCRGRIGAGSRSSECCILMDHGIEPRELCWKSIIHPLWSVPPRCMYGVWWRKASQWEARCVIWSPLGPETRNPCVQRWRDAKWMRLWLKGSRRVAGR